MNYALIYTRRALVIDFICIIVACLALYLGYNNLISYLTLLYMAVISLVLLLISLFCFFKGRILERKAREEEEMEDFDDESEEFPFPDPETWLAQREAMMQQEADSEVDSTTEGDPEAEPTTESETEPETECEPKAEGETTE